MKRDEIINGFRIGIHSFDPDKVIDEINEKCKEGMNYVAFSTNHMPGGPDKIEQKYFIEWAKYLADRKMYFSFDGGGNRKSAGFTLETAKKMKEIAGKYFMVYSMGEMGTYYSCAASGYPPFQKTKWKDMKEAKEFYINRIKEAIEGNSMGDILDTTIIEAFSMIMHNVEAGISYPTIEFWPGNMETAAVFARGAASSFNRDKWAAYMAHEWYGGLKWDDMKLKRFKMGYEYAYMSGAKIFVNEDGDERAGLQSGITLDYDHPIPQHYRKVMADFALFAKNDVRPSGGPKVKVAFVYGNLDAYSFGRFSGSMWRGHLQKDFGYDSSEFAWRILDNIYKRRTWCDVNNYGDVDLSGAPAYGQYDVISANASADVFSKYDYLIFCGWNSMTDEIYQNLKTFVNRGGRLFMTAAHLNTSVKRDGSISLINEGDVSDLFGCTLDAANAIESEDGCKFHDSIVPELRYPSLRFDHGDPAFAEGYITYADTTLTTGSATARLSNKFVDSDEEAMPISLVENKCGEGYAALLTTLEYPYGASAPIYQALVKEILSASHRCATIKVYGADPLRFSVYEGDKVYLLNTDFDNDIVATIDYGNHKEKFILGPCEFKAVEKK